MRTPWLLLAAAFALGLLIPSLLVGGLLLALALGVRRGGVQLLLVAAGAGAVAGAAEAHWREAMPGPPDGAVDGVVEAVELRGERVRVRMRPDRAPRWRVEAWQARRPAGLAPGSRARVFGPLRRPPPAYNPGGFDAEGHAAARRVAWRAQGPVQLRAPAPTHREVLVRAREAARAHLDRVRRPFGAAVLRGLLLGDRHAVPSEARVALEASGTAHLMAVSGLHVGGVALVLVAVGGWFGRRLGFSSPARWSAALALPSVWAFVALAQFPLSACRAGSMVALVLLGRVLHRPASALNLLGAAAVLILAVEPGALRGPGFQLSFGVVAALLLLARGRGWLTATLAASVVASLAAAPIQAWHFGTWAPLAPVANLLLTPLASLVLVPLGLLGLLLAPVTNGPLSLAAVLAEWLVAAAEVFTDASGGAWVVGAHLAPALAAPLALFAGIAAGRRPLALTAGAGLVAASLGLSPPAHSVDFVAVGQGDAVLVRSGSMAALVDVGPDRRARPLLGYLRHLGVAHVDTVYLSHGHPDHDGGLEAVVEALGVRRVVHNRGRLTTGRWRALRRRLRSLGVRFHAARPGEIHRLGDLRLRLLGTEPPSEHEENDASLVLRVDGPGASVLLTGDLEAAGEARLVAAGIAPVDVLKAPHHGSRTSSSTHLLDSARPAAVVFTVGRDNRYGFPHPEVSRRYASRGITAWRTDAHGRVRVDLDDGRVDAMRDGP